MIILIQLTAVLYRYLLKPVLFLFDPEKVHVSFVRFGQFLGATPLRRILGLVFNHPSPRLLQIHHGLTFSSPVGLAAGFDYEARLTQVLPFMGFGFGTIGTITRRPFAGNPRPMLGRLLLSRSLMVNKGFKNPGIKKIIKDLSPLSFAYPVGLSIGKTNIKSIDDLKSGLNDITSSFKLAESSSLKHAYYELNISCPNVTGRLTFYDPKNLEALLAAVDSLNLSRPVFMKLPIGKTDQEFLSLLKVISRHSVQGIIIGNLQTNRRDPSLNQAEVARFPVGNFSGLPTQKRSDELISLAYRHYDRKLLIVGCGGVFSAADAYRKIKAGASLIQLITGLIYQGPQLVAEINHGLPGLLQADNFTHLSQAVGAAHRSPSRRR